VKESGRGSAEDTAPVFRIYDTQGCW